MLNKKKSKHGKKKISKGKNIIISIFTIILICSIVYLICHFYTQWKNKSQMEELAKFMENVSNEEISTKVEEGNEEIGTEVEEKDNAMLQKLKELKEQNSDLIGWIKIEDTNINYPVLQTENNNYYVNHDFKKKSNELGSIFLDNECSITKPTVNFLIYGHRSKRWANV